MSIEQAIVNFAIQGALQVGAASDKIVADLSSAERAGKAAEAAAVAGQRTVEELQQVAQKVQQTIGRIAAIGGFAERAIEGLTGSDFTVGGFQPGQFLGAAASGAAVGAQLGSLVPGVGTLLGTVAGATVGGVANAVQQSRDIEEAAERAAQKTVAALERERKATALDRFRADEAIRAQLARHGRGEP